MPRLPNILILLLDTARAQSFSGYGYTRQTTPHIDALAAESVVYDQAIATGCWSLPAQVSLLTGLFPSTHGAHELHRAYAHAYPLLPEVLREQGYCTLGVSPNSWMSDEFGVTHGFEHYVKLWQYRHTAPASADSAGWLNRLHKRLNRWYARQIFPHRNQAWHVNHHVRTLLAQATEPFFMYAIYWDTHLPYAAPDAYLAPWLPQPMTLRQAHGLNRDPWQYITGQVSMTEEDFQGLQSCYDAALASLDTEIGHLIDWLRQRRVLDHTLLIITSDHGENLGDHGLMSHAYSLHDSLLHVPLLIRYPACFPSGQRVPQQMQLTDLFPTILDALGLSLPDVRRPLQGRSLLAPASAAADARLAYAEMLAPQPSIASLNRRTGAPETTPRPALERALRCVRTPAIKLIWASDGTHELYDLHRDPHEAHNLYATEPALAQEYLTLLRPWQPAPSAVAPPPPMDEDVRQRLRALGYLE